MKRRMRRTIAPWLLVVLAGPVLAQPVPLGDRVYDLLDQASLRGVIEGPLDTRPYSRSRVAELLVAVEDARRRGEALPASMAGELRRRLEIYRREIDELIDPGWWAPVQPYRSPTSDLARRMLPLGWTAETWSPDGHALSLRYPGGQWATVDPVYSACLDTREEDKRFFRRSWGIALEAGLLPALNAWVRWQDFAEWGNDPYDSRDKLVDDRVGWASLRGEKSTYYEDLTGGLTLQHGPLMVLFGRDRVRWGPGRRGDLLLSGESSPLLQFRLSVRFGPSVQFTSLAGALHAWPEVADTLYTAPSGRLRRSLDDKYLSAHRLEIALSRGLSFGLSEAVVYGERALSLSYLNPVSVYFSDEHDQGDQDNVILGVDARIDPAAGVSAWGELILDDFRFAKLGSSYFGNKVGWLGGAALAGPGGILPVEIGAEYAGLRPFVYSHVFPINTFKQWNAPLGLQLQPNSDRTSLWAEWWPLASVSAGLEAELIRHGENGYENGEWLNAGGDIDLPHREIDPEEAAFLGGLRRDHTRVQAWTAWWMLENLALHAMIGYDRDDSSGTEGLIGSLAFSWNAPVDRRWTLRGR